jgi:hypothetical protein
LPPRPSSAVVNEAPSPPLPLCSPSPDLPATEGAAEEWADHTLATPFEVISRHLETALLSLLSAPREDSRVVETGLGVSLLLRMHASPGDSGGGGEDADDGEFSAASFARRWFGVKGWYLTLVAV